MTPERKRELDRYFSARNGGQAAPAGIKPPTEDEALQYSQSGTPQATAARTAVRDSGSRGTIGPTNSQPSTTGTIGPAVTKGTFGPKLTKGTITPVTSRGTFGPVNTGGNAQSGGTNNSRSGAGNAGTGGGQAMPRDRSAWSEFLHQAMEEAGGDPRAMRIPFEQHPRQVFDRFQNVAQPGQPTMPSGQSFPTMPSGMSHPAMDRAAQTFGGAMERAGYPGQSAPPMPSTRGPMPPALIAGRPQPRLNDPGFPAHESMMPSFDPRSMPARSYNPPPSYRQPQDYRQPNEAQAMMDRYRTTGSF